MTPVLDLGQAPFGPGLGGALPLAARLREYEITGVCGQSDLGVVYAAFDHALLRQVAIKEYLPEALAARDPLSAAVIARSEPDRGAFRAGLKSFVDEARVLARFDHPSLVKVYRYWEEHGTAYRVMPLLEGPTLQAALAELGHVPGEAELRIWLRPILDSVGTLHEGGVWHRNIGPDEIVFTDAGPVLLGLASARHTIAATQRAPARALKPGFAAIEQYSDSATRTAGPWTDLYAVAATLYAAITGSAPDPADARLARDRVQPLSIVAAGLYSDRFLAAIDAALAVQPELRPRDHREFRALLGDIEAPAAPASLAPSRDLMQEPFLGLVGDRETTVPDRPPLEAGLAQPGFTQPDAAMAIVEGRRPAKPGAEPTAHDSASAAEAAPRGTAPTWMRGSGAVRRFGKRALYGVVAVTCVLIGVAALALQFSGRQGARPPAATSALPLPAAPATAPLAASMPSLSVAPAPPPALASAAAAGPLAAAASGVAAQGKQSRCIEILQKASLEPISVAETEFFKAECK